MHLGTPEIIGVGVLVLLLFGAKKLPELGKSLGQGIKEFRKSTKEIIAGDEEAAKEESDSAAS